MELLLTASLMLASAMSGVYFTRQQALKQLNDLMLHIITGMNNDEASLQAELDEIWRAK